MEKGKKLKIIKLRGGRPTQVFKDKKKYSRKSNKLRLQEELRDLE